MDINLTIFVVTVFEHYKDPANGVMLGSTRSPCFRPTFELAEEVVKNNMCDIWETCYDYAVISEIGPELYPYPMMQKYYKYNRDINGYEPIEKPKCLEHSHICGIS